MYAGPGRIVLFHHGNPVPQAHAALREIGVRQEDMRAIVDEVVAEVREPIEALRGERGEALSELLRRDGEKPWKHAVRRIREERAAALRHRGGRKAHEGVE